MCEFYATVSAVYWVVCLGLLSCECMSIYNYRCVCVSQCENVSLLSHMRWQSLSRAPFDIRRILSISQHTLSFWKPTHSLFNLLSLSLSGFDIEPDYPQCIWYFYKRWQQSLRPEQVPVRTKNPCLDNVKDIQVSRSMREAILEGFWAMNLPFQCWQSWANAKLTDWSSMTVNST